MTIIDQSGPPPGFIRYSIEYPAECVPAPALVLPDSAMEALQNVNRYWNANIEPIPMPEWRAMDGASMNHWHVFDKPGNRGVCHDYAATKRRNLATYAGALSLAWCDTDEGYHLVLLANLRSGVVVLDNMRWTIHPVAAVEYQWIRCQAWDNPNNWITNLI